MEENLRNIRQELETFYNKLLHQLHARDNRGKPRRQGRSSVKVRFNYLLTYCMYCREQVGKIGYIKLNIYSNDSFAFL